MFKKLFNSRKLALVQVFFLLILMAIPLIEMRQQAILNARLEPKPYFSQSTLTAKIHLTNKGDRRAEILQAYLARYNSPLQAHAADFIEAADTYNMDWKLVPAIAGVESTFGKHIPGGYNGWGWGVYGNQALGFKSWRHGIFTVAEGLKKNYIDKGLTTPIAMNRIYASSPTWGTKVNYFLNDIVVYFKCKKLKFFDFKH